MAHPDFMTTATAINFEKEGVVSVWYSTATYLEIPDSYFEEDENGLDQWARNFQIGQYDAELLETNGTDSGTMAIIDAIGPCSYSNSYGEAVIHKINKMGRHSVCKCDFYHISARQRLAVLRSLELLCH